MPQVRRRPRRHERNAPPSRRPCREMADSSSCLGTST
jgi:hypothetical protein